MITTGAIFAQSVDGIIGDGHGMPWHLPEDLIHFKNTTMHDPVLMGRKTWESLPEKNRPLPGRENIILSRREPGQWSQGAEIVTKIPDRDYLWIIGGGEIYDLTIRDVDVIEVTIIDVLLEDTLGDTAVYAPKIPDYFEKIGDSGWKESEQGRLLLGDNDQKPLRYRFQRYHQ